MFNLLAGILGLVLLTLGSEMLIRAAKSLGIRFGLSATTMGVLVIGYGTSLPELSSSYMAVFQGKAGLAVGNVLGSNIFNILFILGLSALLTPLSVTQELLKKTLPLMVFVSSLTIAGFYLSVPLWILGAVLVACFFTFTLYSLRAGESEKRPDLNVPQHSGGLLKSLGLLGLGIASLVGGTGLFIQGATWLAVMLGVSEAVIGLSVVAIGTSLPEVFTSVLAALKKERSLVLGNIVGSNIFNLSAVLGGSLLFSRPVEFQDFSVDFAVMFISAVICVPFFYSSRKVGRMEGAILLSGYVGYFYWMLIRS